MKLIHVDRLDNGIIEKSHYDEATDTLLVEKVEDVRAVIEANKQQFDVDNKRHKNEVFNHVARVPRILIDNYKNKTGIDLLANGNESLFRRWLNDPDNRAFRTKPGRL